MSDATALPYEAKASERPCELLSFHQPRPTRTQGHHIHPVYLQNRVYGKIQDTELRWLCGTCHDNVHEWLSYLLGEAREPSPHPGRAAKQLAYEAFSWYMKELNLE